MDISIDSNLLKEIQAGYKNDPWCAKLPHISAGMAGFHCDKNTGLWYIGDCLVIPRIGNIHETLFRLAHNSLGHAGIDKAYGALRGAYYWPNMHCDLIHTYIPGCMECQRFNSSTHKKCGPLHPLPIPDAKLDSVAIDFVGPLLEDDGFNQIVTMTDRLGADIQIAPCKITDTAEDFALIFFKTWYCENGLPLEIVCDRDKLFVS